MRCTNKKIAFLLAIVIAAFSLIGCSDEIEFDTAFDIASSKTNSDSNMTDFANELSDITYFADNLCVGDDIFTKSDYVSDSVVDAMGVFLPEKGEISYSKNIYEKMYPASTTKIMTAYLAIEHGDLDKVVTVSENACNQAADSSKAGLVIGDKIKLGDLVYGLLLPSGNDAAVAIAEEISGSVEEFANLMNETAKEFGATATHFVNPNGLHDEDHYTTVYDLYLIFSHCIENETFIKYISTKSYTAYYTAGDGGDRSKTWTNTNKYINGEVVAPSGITSIGGKTGTTNAAGYCLILYSKNKAGDPVISIVLKGDCRDNLYYVMNQLLTNFS